MRMLRDGRTGDRGEERAAQGVAEGVAEARLQRLDHEPGAELVDDLFGQRGTLSDQHCVIPSVMGARYLTPAATEVSECCHRDAGDTASMTRAVPPGTADHAQARDSRERASDAAALRADGSRCAGCGVTSWIEPTSRPVAWSERIAVSRPEPGPLTKTSTLLMPCSCARRAADSAAICAAKGVDLREPLKPTWPAEAQEITLPDGVGDRDDRVVERALDVGVPVSDVLLFLAAHLLGSALTALGGHAISPTGGGRSYSEDR